MRLIEIRIPHLGEGADSGAIVNIFVKEGDSITKDQTLLELENEKAVAPIPSPQAGVVKKIHVKVGDKVTVGQAVLSLAESGAPVSTGAAPAAPSITAREAVAAPKAETHHESKIGAPPAASPTVRRMARDLGIDLTRVRGSESGGRIGVQDLRAYIQHLQFAPQASASAPAASVKPSAEKHHFEKWGAVERKPVSSLRQKIGQKMTESWTTTPHITQFDEADITALMAYRKKFAAAYEKKGAKLTVTPLLIRAVVSALKKYPSFNSSLDEEKHEIVLKHYFNIGVAVDTDAGLIVPVLHDADKKDLFSLAKELDQLAEKTRQRKVSLDDLKGGSFTISNLGGIGGGHFTPIINKPEVAILGVGKGALKPVAVSGGNFEPRLLLPLSLSYDHRVVDGADGARFLRHIVETLENTQESDVKI